MKIMETEYPWKLLSRLCAGRRYHFELDPIWEKLQHEMQILAFEKNGEKEKNLWCHSEIFFHYGNGAKYFFLF